MSRDARSNNSALSLWAMQVMADRGWTQAQWASRAGVHPATVHRILTSDGYSPRFGTLERLCVAAGSRPQIALGQFDDTGAIRSSRRRWPIEHPDLRIATTSVGPEAEIAEPPALASGFASVIVYEAAADGGFRSGDLVIFKPLSEGVPISGDLVLVELPEHGLSVARFDGNRIYHEPAGIFPSQTVLIKGIVIQLLRSFA